MTTFHDRPSLHLGSPVLGKLAARTADDVRGNLGLTVHHTGYGGTLYHIDPVARLRGIYDYHVLTLGYGDIAYEGAFDADGNTYGLRDSKWVGAHALGTRRGGSIPNRLTDGIVYLEDARGWTHAAAVALGWWADLYAFTHGRHPHLFAHEYWSLTSCPGPYLVDVVRYLGGSA